MDEEFDLKGGIKFLLDSFRIERFIYLGVTVLSIVLLGAVVWMKWKRRKL
jgi:hypothetical protein